MPYLVKLYTPSKRSYSCNLSIIEQIKQYQFMHHFYVLYMHVQIKISYTCKQYNYVHISLNLQTSKDMLFELNLFV